jgi:hypothetical protein
MTAHDPETGEVLEGPHWETQPDGARVFVGEEPPRKRRKRAALRAPGMTPGTWRWDTADDGRRFKRPLTPEEITERERFRAEKEEREREHRNLIAALMPIVAPEGDPPTAHEQLFPMSAGKYPGKVMVELPRTNGSAFVMTHRAWSGEDHGVEPFEYVNCYIRFTKNGLRYRTRGVMFRDVVEMRAAARALEMAADRIGEADETPPEPEPTHAPAPHPTRSEQAIDAAIRAVQSPPPPPPPLEWLPNGTPVIVTPRAPFEPYRSSVMGHDERSYRVAHGAGFRVVPHGQVRRAT